MVFMDEIIKIILLKWWSFAANMAFSKPQNCIGGLFQFWNETFSGKKKKHKINNIFRSSMQKTIRKMKTENHVGKRLKEKKNNLFLLTESLDI